MVRNMSFANRLKQFLLIYLLPGDAVTETFPIVLSAFVTILAFLRNVAISDSLNDLTNATLFQQPGFAEDYVYVDDNYSEFEPNYTIAVSNAVLWVCREGSPNAGFYRIFYAGALFCLVLFHLLTAFSRFFTPAFWHVRKQLEDDSIDNSSMSSRFTLKYSQHETFITFKKDVRTATKTIIGSVVFNFSLLMLLLSFDISPWSCIQKPSSQGITVNYAPITNRFHIHIDHDPAAIVFQQGAAITSAVLMCVWLIFHVVFLCHDYMKGDVNRIVDQLASLVPLLAVEADEGDDEDNYIT